MTLTFNLLNSGSPHAQRQPRSICLPSLVLIAHAVFLPERGQTHPKTHKHSHRCNWPVITLSTPRISPAWVTIYIHTGISVRRYNIKRIDA